MKNIYLDSQTAKNTIRQQDNIESFYNKQVAIGLSKK